MCERILARRSDGGLSRNPTVSRTPPAPQYLEVKSARRSTGMTVPGKAALKAVTAGAFVGLISTAFFAADVHSLGGSVLILQVTSLMALSIVSREAGTASAVCGAQSITASFGRGAIRDDQDSANRNSLQKPDGRVQSEGVE